MNEKVEGTAYIEREGATACIEGRDMGNCIERDQNKNMLLFINRIW